MIKIVELLDKETDAYERALVPPEVAEAAEHILETLDRQRGRVETTIAAARKRIADAEEVVREGQEALPGYIVLTSRAAA
jgi:predicted  nucleic acid-binding Zn-ribbon protein